MRPKEIEGRPIANQTCRRDEWKIRNRSQIEPGPPRGKGTSRPRAGTRREEQTTRRPIGGSTETCEGLRGGSARADGDAAAQPWPVGAVESGGQEVGPRRSGARSTGREIERQEGERASETHAVSSRAKRVARWGREGVERVQGGGGG